MLLSYRNNGRRFATFLLSVALFNTCVSTPVPGDSAAANNNNTNNNSGGNFTASLPEDVTSRVIDNVTKGTFEPSSLPKRFENYDVNGDSAIDVRELANVSETVVQDAGEPFHDADINHDGLIDQDEFRNAPWDLDGTFLSDSNRITVVNEDDNDKRHQGDDNDDGELAPEVAGDNDDIDEDDPDPVDDDPDDGGDDYGGDYVDGNSIDRK